MKSRVGSLLATLFVVLGVVGFLLDAIGKLPEGFPLPDWALSAMTLIPLIIVGLGWQDDLEGGKRGLLDLFENFLKDPYRKLALVVLATAARSALGIVGLPNEIGLALQGFLAILAALNFEGAKERFAATLALRAR